MGTSSQSEQLKILIVDDSLKRLHVLIQALNVCGYHNVTTMQTNEVIIDEIHKNNPDIILIDVESPTRDTLEQLTLIRREQPTPVVLFTQDHHVQSINSAIQSGVSAYVLDGISPERVKPAIDIAMATFSSFQELRTELEKVRSTLEDQKLITRAKGILMKQRQLSEDEAYHFIRKMAMDRKRKLPDAAQDIISLRDVIG